MSKDRFEEFEEGSARRDRVLEHYDRELEREPEQFELWHEKAIHLARLGRVVESRACLDEAIRLAPERAVGWRTKGQLLGALDDLVGARACFEEATRLDPQDLQSWLDLGRLCGLEARFEEALACGEQACEIAPDRAEALELKGLALEKLDRPAEATQSFEALLAHRRWDSEAWYRVGALLCQAGEDERALGFLDRCLALQPDHPLALANRGSLFAYAGRVDEALADLERALALDPGDLVALWNRAEALRKGERREDAIEGYRAFVARARGVAGWEEKVREAEGIIAQV
jgi:tetratricopeptide (TPR) repeat protein